MAMDNAGLDAARRLLEGRTAAEVEQMSIAALRAWHRESPDASSFTMHADLGRRLVPLLAERAGTPITNVNPPAEAFNDAQHDPAFRSVVDLVWRLVAAGVLVPAVGSTGGRDHPTRFQLTAAGARFLEADSPDHPLMPGFATRLQARCAGLPDSALALFADAQACLERGLTRPAVVLLGVGYESVVEHVVDALCQRGHLPASATSKKAAQRIEEIRTVLGKLGLDVDDREAARHALDFADALRRRRNDGSHTKPRFPFDSSTEVEELIVSAGRHLPNLWRLAR